MYRGVFVWNGSQFAKAKARRENRKLTVQEFARPHLRLVEDSVWQACNSRGKVKFRSGRRHLVSGLLTCGACDARLATVSTKPPQVYSARSAIGQSGWVRPKAWMGYVSANAVIRVIRHVLRKVLNPSALTEFRGRLRERLSGDQTAEVRALEQKIARSTRACERLAHLLRVSETSSTTCLAVSIRRRGRNWSRPSGSFCLRKESVTAKMRAAIEQQVKVNAFDVLDRMLDDCANVERTQAVLHRLLPRIALVAKPRRFVAEFEVTLAQGVALSLVSETAVIEPSPVTVRVRVTSGARRPTPWQVETI